MDPRERLAALAQDRTRGASEITQATLEALEALAEAGTPPEALTGAALQVAQAHPAMAPLINLVGDLIEALPEHGAQAPVRLAEAAATRQATLVAQGAARLPEDGHVVTYSRSGSVLGALLEAQAAGKRFKLTLSEARPGQEGLRLARELAEAGLAVTLTVDAGLEPAIRSADLLLLGADGLCRRGAVNKAGTGLLALAAQEAGCPVEVLASTDKRLPSAIAEAPALTTQGQLEAELGPGIETTLPLFELVAYTRLDAIVTEHGPQAPAELQADLEALSPPAELLAHLEGARDPG